jgi:hypothetical protein
MILERKPLSTHQKWRHKRSDNYDDFGSGTGFFFVITRRGIGGRSGDMIVASFVKVQQSNTVL